MLSFNPLKHVFVNLYEVELEHYVKESHSALLPVCINIEVNNYLDVGIYFIEYLFRLNVTSLTNTKVVLA